MSQLRCFLRSLNGLHPDISLPDNRPVVIGRGPQTKVKDSRCSREQLSLVADYAERRVSVTQLGRNASGVDQEEIGHGKVAVVEHGVVLRLLTGYKDGLKVYFLPEKRKLSGNATPEKKPKMEPVNMSLGAAASKGGFIWEVAGQGDVHIMTSDGCLPKNKVAAFDMDGTLITTRSGRVFPVDSNDWQILYAEVPAKLRTLHSQGYKVVVLTNQGGIAKGKVKVDEFKLKAERIAQKLNVPMQLFCCAGEGGMFRKPRTGVWKLLTEVKNGGLEIKISESFYCGDAAGRDKDWQQGKKKDFSCSDRLFALNLGLRFETPEEFFLGQKPTSKFHLPEYDPKSIKSDASLLEPKTAVLLTKTQEVVMFVGMQGSGKSFLSETVFEPAGYVVASNDRSGSRDKTLRVMDQALTQGKSVVVDNTHAEKESRQKYLEVAKKHKVPCRCFLMTTTPQQARHNNIFRELTGSSHTKIKEALFNTYKSKYQEPKLEEGFSEIVRVNFVPKFPDEEAEKLYRMYLQEK